MMNHLEFNSISSTDFIDCSICTSLERKGKLNTNYILTYITKERFVN